MHSSSLLCFHFIHFVQITLKMSVVGKHGNSPNGITVTWMVILVCNNPSVLMLEICTFSPLNCVRPLDVLILWSLTMVF
jgi:hypothetical protein